MNAYTITFVPTDSSREHRREKKHQRLVMLVSLIAIGAIVALLVYGADYYRLGQADRAFSPKHHLLRPSGIVGINLGLLGVLMLCGIFLYPLRKRWGWLQKQGNSKHWLDHHVVLGVAAPLCIAFHASFKFRGLAGMAFWVMVAVSLSGLIGRYLYAQIQLQVAAAESSLLGVSESARASDDRSARPNCDGCLFRVPAPEQGVALVGVYRAGLHRGLRLGPAVSCRPSSREGFGNQIRDSFSGRVPVYRRISSLKK